MSLVICSTALLRMLNELNPEMVDSGSFFDSWYYDIDFLQDDRMVKIWYENKKCKFVKNGFYTSSQF